jgi:O-antigen/teichoic acid export membrane protein
LTKKTIEITSQEALFKVGREIINVRRTADWDLRSGPKNYLILVGSQVISFLSSFAAIWLVTRTIGTEGYGGVAAIFAAAQVGTVGLQWSAYALNRFGCEEFVRTGKITNAFWTRKLIFAANLLLFLTASPWWLPRLSEWLKIPPQAHSLIIVYLILTALWMHIQQALMAAKLVRHQGILLAVERLVIVLILSALILAGKASLYTIFIAYNAGALIVALSGLWWLRKLVGKPQAFDNQLFRQMLKYSFPLIPYSLTAYFSTNYLDAFFITRYLSVADLGVYNLAYLLSGAAMQFLTVAGGLLLPLFVTLQVHAQGRKTLYYLQNILPFLTLLWSMICTVVAVVGTYLIPMVFGSGYEEAADLLWPLMGTAALAGPILLGYGAFSNASSATYMGAVTAIFAAITNLSLNIILIPSYGLMGCAWATVGAYGMGLLVMNFLITRRMPSVGRLSLVATLPTLTGAAVATWRHENFSPLILSLMVFLIIIASCRKSFVAGCNRLLAAKIRGSAVKLFHVKEAL